MENKKNIARTLELLEAQRTRATYAAVAGILGCDPRQVGRFLGPRRPEASWVVSGKTGLPTGYKPHELHRELQVNRRIIADSAELSMFLKQGRNEPIGVDELVPGGVEDSFVERSFRDGDQFELLIAEVYRKLGYRVTERGGRRPDGGVDLEVVKDGRRKLVQCKFRKRDAVGVKVARELLGVMHHERAHGAVLVSPGDFTADARAFASANGIELIDGEGVRRMLRQTGVDGERLMRKVRRRSRGASIARTFTGRVALYLGVVAVGAGVIKYSTDHVISSLSHGNLVTSPRSYNSPDHKSSGEPASSVAATLEKPVVEPSLAESEVAERERVASERESSEIQTRQSQFEQWYQPPVECIASSTNPMPDLVACGNHRIRARRTFESLR